MAPKPDISDDVYEKLMGSAFRYAAYELSADGLSLVYEGPAEVTKDDITARLNFHQEYEPHLLRKFVVLATDAAPPEPLFYGVATEATPAEEIEDSMLENALVGAGSKPFTIFWEEL